MARPVHIIFRSRFLTAEGVGFQSTEQRLAHQQRHRRLAWVMVTPWYQIAHMPSPTAWKNISFHAEGTRWVGGRVCPIDAQQGGAWHLLAFTPCRCSH